MRAQFFVRKAPEGERCTYRVEDYLVGPVEDVAARQEVLSGRWTDKGGRQVQPGEVVYISDLFYTWEEGEWHLVPPGPFADGLYRLARG